MVCHKAQRLVISQEEVDLTAPGRSILRPREVDFKAPEWVDFQAPGEGFIFRPMSRPWVLISQGEVDFKAPAGFILRHPGRSILRPRAGSILSPRRNADFQAYK